MTEWLPIETAPKDGTLVWLFYADAHADDQQVAGRWRASLTDGPRWMDHADCMDDIQPTHWKPLPEPPTINPEILDEKPHD